MVRRWGDAGRLLAVFGLVSLAAVVIGVAIAASCGVPAAVWARNLAAWLAGAGAACGLAMTARPGVLPIVLWAAPVGLLATLLGPGQDGIRRWLDLGALHLNAAMLLLPMAVVALAGLAPARRWPWVAALVSLALLAAQPDASKATTLAAAAALIAAVVVRPRRARALLIIGLGLMAAAAWLRPDPLPPVPEVEQIISLAFGLSPILAGAAVLLLIALAATPALLTNRDAPEVRLAGQALGLCLLLWAATPALGAFPVPLIGMGMSPIVGAWLGVGLLAAVIRRSNGGVPD